MSKKLKIILFILGILPLIALVIYGYISPLGFFGSIDNIKEIVGRYALLGPLIFIGIQILQVVLTPINHYVVGVAGGVLFGAWFGGLYNWIGRVIGHFIAFLLSRTFGRRLVKKIVGEQLLNKYDRIWEKNGGFYLFLIYFLPVFPDDEISYITGISKMRVKVFLLAAIFGHLGGAFGLSFIGAGIGQRNPFVIGIFVVLTVGCFFLWLFRKKVEKFFEKFFPKKEEKNKF